MLMFKKYSWNILKFLNSYYDISFYIPSYLNLWSTTTRMLQEKLLLFFFYRKKTLYTFLTPRTNQITNALFVSHFSPFNLNEFSVVIKEDTLPPPLLVVGPLEGGGWTPPTTKQKYPFFHLKGKKLTKKIWTTKAWTTKPLV